MSWPACRPQPARPDGGVRRSNGGARAAVCCGVNQSCVLGGTPDQVPETYRDLR